MWLVLAIGCVLGEVVCSPAVDADECPRGQTECERCTSGGEVWFECNSWASERVPVDEEVDAELEMVCHCWVPPGECEVPNWL